MGCTRSATPPTQLASTSTPPHSVASSASSSASAPPQQLVRLIDFGCSEHRSWMSEDEYARLVAEDLKAAKRVLFPVRSNACTNHANDPTPTEDDD